MVCKGTKPIRVKYEGEGGRIERNEEEEPGLEDTRKVRGKEAT